MLRTNSGAAEAALADRQGRPGALGAQSWHKRLKATVKTAWLWWHRHTSRRVLAELDDRMLRDIGLTRDEARRESALPFWRI